MSKDRAETIHLLGYRMRLALWGIVGITVLCLLGLPALLGYEVEPIRNNTWVFSAYMVLDSLFAEPVQLAINIPENSGAEITALQQVLEFSVVELWSIIAVFFVSTAILGAIIWQADRLFALYARGEVFTHTSARRFAYIGWLLIALFVFELLVGNLLIELFPTVEMTGVEMTGVEMIAAEVAAAEELSSESAVSDWSLHTFISFDLALLLSGLFMVMVGRVMQLGAQLQQDVDATI